jgi:thiamine biosynthesis protein ThiS
LPTNEPVMSIRLNGETRPLAQPVALSDLLRQLGLDGHPVVVELNRRALTASELGSCIVSPGDEVEIVRISAGG